MSVDGSGGGMSLIERAVDAALGDDLDFASASALLERQEHVI